MAETMLLEQQDTKTYVGPAGDLEFARAIGELVLGDQWRSGQCGGIQTPGGSGALWVLMSLVKRAAPQATAEPFATRLAW